MTSSAETLLLDTSAAMGLIDPLHPCHSAIREATRGRRLGLSGHAAFELYSVTTRLPYPHRLSGPDASRLIRTNFPETTYLDVEAHLGLIAQFADCGIEGGAVYDALVAACAKAHEATLLTCDQRAEATYGLMGVSYWIIAE